MATITDIAKRAGVSAKTASRVLNKEPYVRDELRERVEEAARALRYTPNHAARHLAGSRSVQIALLCEHPGEPYVAGIIEGAVRRCAELDQYLIVEAMAADRYDGISSAEHRLKAIYPGGVIVLPSLSDNADLVARLRALSLPVVQVASAARTTGLHVYSDDREAGREMTAHLLSLGHRAIGFVRGHPDHRSAMERFDGYREAMQAAQVKIDGDFVFPGYFNVHSGIAAAQAMLSRPHRPTAIFAANDDIAMGLMIGARQLGLDVPGDLSIAGFDDSPQSRAVWPSLTTVAQPLHALGAAAVDLIVTRDTDQGEFKLPFELKIRGSTVPLPPAA